MPSISSHKPYRVGRSRTGLGLFATKPIKKGTKILRYFGPLPDSKKEKDDAIENKYLFELTNRWTIDGSVRENVARYINHACRPNAESDVRPRKRKVYIRAIKNIEPGEEINYDYGTDYFKAYLKPIGCKCDSCEKSARRSVPKRGPKSSAEGQGRAEGAEAGGEARHGQEKAKGSKAKAERQAKKAQAEWIRSNGKSLNGKSPGKPLTGKHLNAIPSVAGKSHAGSSRPRLRVLAQRDRRSASLATRRPHPPGLRTDFGSGESPKSTAER